jgi:hypothetical protein
MLHKLVFSCLIVFLLGTAFAQPSTNNKLIAYKTISSGGAPMLNENGQSVNSTNTTYFVYLSTNSTVQPNIQCIYINQKAYRFKLEKVTSLPIIRVQNNGKKVLVKNTKQKVWQLLIVDEIATNTQESTSENVFKNELVVSFRSKKEMVVKQLEELDPTVYE